MSTKAFLNQIVGLGAIVIAFVACGAKGDKMSDNHLTYQYSENGCDTGKQQFLTLSQLCEGLQDHAANNYCAEGLRRQDFEARCGSSFSNLTAGKAASKPSTKPPVTQNLTSSESNPTVLASLPDQVSLISRSEIPLQITPQNSNGSIITSVTGTLMVKTMEPNLSASLRLLSAESVALESPDLGECQLTVLQFSDVHPDGKIDFTLMGIDQAGMASSGCLGKLPSVTMTGFTVRFTGVPISQLSDQRVRLVTLKVENK